MKAQARQNITKVRCEFCKRMHIADDPICPLCRSRTHIVYLTTGLNSSSSDASCAKYYSAKQKEYFECDECGLLFNPIPRKYCYPIFIAQRKNMPDVHSYYAIGEVDKARFADGVNCVYGYGGFRIEKEDVEYAFCEIIGKHIKKCKGTSRNATKVTITINTFAHREGSAPLHKVEIINKKYHWLD